MEQRELRRAAAKAFMESLDKLQETLSESETKTEAQPMTAPAMPKQLEEFEQAVADIEQFMQSKGESA
ncbi:hypothetical protein [Myxacorys almedinensis]|uniref:Uncharacterized protein n=1 Tax=Myxacorys almedinensis A TaxID=2690445 RepID=A0A8J8CKH1_9CYAN|nr:hypothetical protein [Myxacorys almedinensis]NDJ16640.1 hypothetical protein [Myxacorys almedinensis A]